MTQDQPRLHRRCSSAQQFLLYKTDPKSGADISGGKPSIGWDDLSKEFPDILSGNSFVEQAMASLDSSSKFGVMVVRIDTDDVSGNINQAEIMVDVAKTINAICKRDDRIWGWLDPDVLACFFSETNAALGLELAKKLQNNLAEHRYETVSTGIASYPFVDFKKDEIIDNALKALNHATFFGPNSVVSFDAVSLNISGDQLYQKGDINGAIEEFKKALLIDPSNVNVHNSLGVCYGGLGAYEKAIKSFEAAIQLDPGEVMAVYNAGLANSLINNKDKALEHFLQADSLGEELFEVAFQTGKLYLEKGQFKKGRNFLEKAIRLRPESGPAFRYLGECYAALKMTDEALAAYKKAIKQNPGDADSLSALGYLLDVQGESIEISTIFCQQSVEISPDNGLFRHRLGQLYLKQNQLEDALKEFKRADDLGCDSTEFIEKARNLMLEA